MALTTTIAAVSTAVIAAGSAAYSYKQGKDAAKSAKGVAAENAARALAESKEAARRLKGQQEANLSEARARAAASGVGSGGSQGQYIEGMEAGFKAELAWLKKSGTSAAAIERRKGDLAAGAASSAATGSAFATLGQGAQGSAQWYAAGQ